MEFFCALGGNVEVVVVLSCNVEGFRNPRVSRFEGTQFWSVISGIRA